MDLSFWYKKFLLQQRYLQKEFDCQAQVPSRISIFSRSGIWNVNMKMNIFQNLTAKITQELQPGLFFTQNNINTTANTCQRSQNQKGRSLDQYIFCYTGIFTNKW